jgi:hypothetical protein
MTRVPNTPHDQRNKGVISLKQFENRTGFTGSGWRGLVGIAMLIVIAAVVYFVWWS